VKVTFMIRMQTGFCLPFVELQDATCRVQEVAAQKKLCSMEANASTCTRRQFPQIVSLKPKNVRSNSAMLMHE